MHHRQTLGIIGSGPSCIYLLKHLLNGVADFREKIATIEIFEKRRIAGMGMPYHPETTDRINMCNISSEELPELQITFAEWLRRLPAAELVEYGIQPEEISETEVYSRLAMGGYLQAQYRAIAAELTDAGITVRDHEESKIVDVRHRSDGVVLIEEGGTVHRFDRVVIATGHYWPEDDKPEAGYYASPWPIAKLLPAKGELFNFTIGTLGASLSAFDVVASLAHRHGRFEKKGDRLEFIAHPGAGKFRIAMHAADGLLPHLQYAQAEPLRAIHRHISESDLLELRDANGFLRLATYFDKVCRPVLLKAFQKDERPDIVALLRDRGFGLEHFVKKMTQEHTYADAFEGMRSEMREAEESLERDEPIHWKEAVDDLMYTLSFYAELLPAEDHQTLHQTFLPFVMNVIAALPLASALRLLALRDAGKLEIIPGRAEIADRSGDEQCTTVKVDRDGEESEFTYRMFVECGGQSTLPIKEFPFPTLRDSGVVREACASFASSDAADGLPEEQQKKIIASGGRKWLPTGGIDIDPCHRVVDQAGASNDRIFDISFPHTSGIRPYSYGLQACNDTARLLVEGWAAHTGKLDHVALKTERRGSEERKLP